MKRRLSVLQSWIPVCPSHFNADNARDKTPPGLLYPAPPVLFIPVKIFDHLNMEAVGTMGAEYQAPNTELMSFKPMFVKLPF